MMNDVSMIVRSPPNSLRVPESAFTSAAATAARMNAKPSVRCFITSDFVAWASNALNPSSLRDTRGDGARPYAIGVKT